MTVALLVVAIAGAGYLALACARTSVFAMRSTPRGTEFLPTVTILKPISGLEPELYENLRTFCDQEYDAFYEVVFCFHDTDDPALPVGERLAVEFPAQARVAVGNNGAMRNPKIANLAKAQAAPRGEIVVIADSDVQVGRDYLRALVTAFETQRTGAATCLYAGMPNASLVSRLGAMQIEEVFIPSVLVALALGPLRFCMGATMAVRRNLLETIGGLEALGATIADDHRLGELVAATGEMVELSRYVVRTAVPERAIAQLWSHELRWARTNLALAPAGYACSFLMYALPWAVLYLAVSRNLAFGLPLLGVVAGLRIALHYLSRAALHVERDDVALIPIRDVLSLAVWFASFFSRNVRWRERTYRSR